MVALPEKTEPEELSLDHQQLSAAVGYSWERLKLFRENRVKLMKELAGFHYSENGAPDRVPINLIELAQNIYLQRLVAQAPKVKVTTDFMQLKEISGRFEMAMDHLVDEIDLGDTLEMAVIGAMLSMGIVKVGLNLTEVELGGVLMDAGQPFAKDISLADWVQDMTANKKGNPQFEGDFYNITEDEFTKLYPNIEFLTQDEMLDINEEHDHKVSEGESRKREQYKKTVRMLDLWLPKQNQFLICLASEQRDDPIDRVLKVIEWEGPERGPYHKLGFGKLENNPMPVAPAMHWADLHDLVNKVFRKLGRQAGRQKTILGVRPAGDNDGTAVVNANDGDVIKMEDPKNVGEFKTGGIDQTSFAFSLALQDMFKMLAGNLDALGGLGPQSETLGQDRLLNDSANTRMQKMQKSTVIFATGIIKSLAFYLWNDPHIEIPLVKRVKGFDDITIPANFGPEDRENDFMEYNIKIQPYSMQFMTPSQKLQGLMVVFERIISPLIPMMQTQGVTLNIEAFLKTVADLSDIEEVNDIITYANPQIQQGEPVGQPPAKAPVTTRTNIRRNVSSSTNANRNKIIAAAALGQNSQPAEQQLAVKQAG